MEEEARRKKAIRRHLNGEKPARIWDDLGRSERWFYKWLQRYRENGPEWFRTRSRAPNNVANKTDPKIEHLIVETREKLENQKYAQIGSLAIKWSLSQLGVEVPSTRTIERILRRHNKTDGSNTYEPKGTNYPAVPANRPGDLHQIDFVGPRHIRGDGRFYCLNVMDIASHRAAITPSRRHRASDVTSALIGTWRRMPLPEHAQMDNAMYFRGSNRYPRSFGLVVRLCLHLGVTPVFIPIQEPWRNGCIERFQDTFDKTFFRGQKFEDFKHLQREAPVFERFHNRNHRYRPCDGRTPNETEASHQNIPACLRDDFELPKQLFIEPGEIHLVRLIRSDRKLDVFGIDFPMPKSVIHEYVTAIIDTDSQVMSVTHDETVIEAFPFEVSQNPMSTKP